MNAFFPAVIALDRRWRRFVGFVAGRPLPAGRSPRPTVGGGAPFAPDQLGGPPRAVDAALGRRFRGPGYRPRVGAPTAAAEPIEAASERANLVPPDRAEAHAAASFEAETSTDAGEARPGAVAPGDPREQATEEPHVPTTAADLAANLDARRAQAAGLRALLLSRQRRYAEAESAFAQAAGIDRGLDLAHLDGFWELERGAHQAAIRAYEAVGRHRDAMGLRATLDGRYRPRLVRTA